MQYDEPNLMSYCCNLFVLDENGNQHNVECTPLLSLHLVGTIQSSPTSSRFTYPEPLSTITYKTSIYFILSLSTLNLLGTGHPVVDTLLKFLCKTGDQNP